MSVEKTVESGGIEIDMGSCAELVEPRVGSPQIRFQVRVMSRAPWHYYVSRTALCTRLIVLYALV